MVSNGPFQFTSVDEVEWPGDLPLSLEVVDHESAVWWQTKTGQSSQSKRKQGTAEGKGKGRKSYNECREGLRSIPGRPI